MPGVVCVRHGGYAWVGEGLMHTESGATISQEDRSRWRSALIVNFTPGQRSFVGLFVAKLLLFVAFVLALSAQDRWVRILSRGSCAKIFRELM